MTLFIVIILLCVLGVLFFYRVARGASTHIEQVDDLGGKTSPVDLQAFRLLIDPTEESFLRRNLAAKQFRKVQRARMLAAAEYVRRINRNAAVLVRLGEAAREYSDPQVAAAASELVNNALQVRLFALFALAKLYSQAALPGMSFNVSDLFGRYQRLTETASLLTRLQRPAYAGRLAAIL